MILDTIIERKRKEVTERRRAAPLDELRSRAGDAPPPADFFGALARGNEVALIAEIKRKSPSAGLIRKDFDPAAIARAYRAGGAAALSVLTDAEFFGGQLEYVAQAKAAAELPVLRKDFVIDDYQLFEARAAQADAVLLIVRVLSPGQLGDYLGLARQLAMAALVETHDAAEIRLAAAAGADIIGINNRDLDSLTVDLTTTETLAPGVPPGRLIVSESGISSVRDIERLARHGAHAVLVGETLMRSPDMAHATRELTGVPRMKTPGRAP